MNDEPSWMKDPRPAVEFSEPTRETLKFTGSGSEYFRIWIVNLVLTILTLGIYSAWAKVRRLRYFYRNTQLAGSSFDYHGDPIAILKGRIVAVGLLLAYNWSPQVSMPLFAAVLIMLVVVMPWLLRQSFRFRLHNSSYRGLRFRFTGPTSQSYVVFLLYGLFTLVTLYLAAPLFHQRLKKYQHGNSRYGQAPFSFLAGVGDFYRAYAGVMLVTLGIFVAAVAIAATLSTGVPAGEKVDPQRMIVVTIAMFGVIFGGFLFIAPLWQARIQNLVWNNTVLEKQRFESSVSARRLFGIYIVNFLLVMLTLGFYKPWADVRLARYRLESVSLLTAGSLDSFVAAQEQATAAVGEETAEFFDLDVGL